MYWVNMFDRPQRSIQPVGRIHRKRQALARRRRSARSPDRWRRDPGSAEAPLRRSVFVKRSEEDTIVVANKPARAFNARE